MSDLLTYGGLETIKSYLPKVNLSTSDLKNFTLLCISSLFAFILHIFKHFLLISIPVPKKFFFSF